jgi:hypothetical protein
MPAWQGEATPALPIGATAARGACRSPRASGPRWRSPGTSRHEPPYATGMASRPGPRSTDRGPAGRRVASPGGRSGSLAGVPERQLRRGRRHPLASRKAPRSPARPHATAQTPAMPASDGDPGPSQGWLPQTVRRARSSLRGIPVRPWGHPRVPAEEHRPSGAVKRRPVASSAGETAAGVSARGQATTARFNSAVPTPGGEGPGGGRVAPAEEPSGPPRGARGRPLPG